MSRFLAFIFILVLFCGSLSASGSKFIVVIDAGHGGKDGGAVRGTHQEKKINLGVALALGQLIEKNFKDVKVVYTRKTDVFIPLDKRADIANKAKANLFISIHTNSTAAKSTSASGADTYILGLARSEENLEVAKRENSVILLEDDYSTKYEGFDPRSPESYIIFEFMTNKFMEQSLQLANFIQSDFKSVAKREDRGVRQAGFLVLRKTSMPSILIELGFINNSTEAEFLSSKSGQQKMALAIYSGFKKYKRDFDKKQGNFSVQDQSEDLSIDDFEDEMLTEVDTESSVVIAKEPENRINKTPKQSNSKIEYRVQFLVSPKKLPANSSQFKGLSSVTFYKEGSTYKYTYGSSASLNEITKVQNQVRLKFKDAFVVKLKDGKRVK